MGKKLFIVLCFFSFIASNYSAEDSTEHNDEQEIYDRLFTRTLRNLQNSIRLKDLNQLDTIQFQGVNKEFEFIPSTDQFQNSTCIYDLIYTVLNITSPWALKMFDSYGKPESSFLLGNLRWLGDYDECTGVRVSNPNSTTVGNFKGKYCSASWTLELFNKTIPFTSGACVPDSCSAKELKYDAMQLLRLAGTLPAFNGTNSTFFNFTSLKCKPTERHLNSAAIAIITLLSIFCALSLLGSSITAFKYFKGIIEENGRPTNAGNISEKHLITADENNALEKHGIPPDDEALLQDAETLTATDSFLKSMETFLGCFCMFTNGAKLLNTSSSEGDLLCIHGIRFLSMSWVILGHTYIFGYAQMRNMLDVFNIINTLPFQAILQAFFSVDSFFVLSGFLLTFLSMKEFSRTKGEISWSYFYIHRYLRLTPMYMILLGFSATVFFYLGSGPYWPDGDYDIACSKVWWRNLIYINNFDLKAGQCMGWSWYLANDMQFFIISPLFLITLWRWPKIGYLLITIFLLATCLCNLLITYHFDLMNGIVTLLNNGIATSDMADALDKFADYFDKLYVKPYTRMGPYLVGMFAGYIFFKRKASNSPKHSLVFLVIGWIIASSVTLATVYGLYDTHPNLIARSIYNALSRFCFAVGLSWVIYVCLIGQGGFVNKLLSFKCFIPLSRLTYAAYLIHPIIITGYFGSLKTSIQFSHPTIVMYFLGFMVVTYALSLPVALVLESPIVSLEKLVRKQFTGERKKEAVN